MYHRVDMYHPVEQHTTNLLQTTLKIYWQTYGKYPLTIVKCFNRVENVVENGEIAHIQQLLHFLKVVCSQDIKRRQKKWERFN